MGAHRLMTTLNCTLVQNRLPHLHRKKPASMISVALTSLTVMIVLVIDTQKLIRILSINIISSALKRCALQINRLKKNFRLSVQFLRLLKIIKIYARQLITTTAIWQKQINSQIISVDVTELHQTHHLTKHRKHNRRKNHLWISVKIIKMCRKLWQNPQHRVWTEDHQNHPQLKRYQNNLLNRILTLHYHWPIMPLALQAFQTTTILNKCASLIFAQKISLRLVSW